MANSMDVIQISYGAQIDAFDRMLSSRKKELEEKEKRIKTVSIAQFLGKAEPKVPLEELSEREKKLQDALLFLYEQNDKDPPLFRSFPKCQKRLLIDATSFKTFSDAAAYFIPKDNKIQFRAANNPLSLVSSLAHELKHAEQHSEELEKIFPVLPDRPLRDFEAIDARAYFQKMFLMEGQAYAREFMTLYNYLKQNKVENWEEKIKETGLFARNELIPVLKQYDAYKSSKISSKSSDKDLFPVTDENLEEQLILSALPYLYQSNYRLQYEGSNPYHPFVPTGPDLDSIPETFHLDNNEKILEMLKTMPTDCWVTDEMLLLWGPENSELFLDLGQEALNQQNTDGCPANSLDMLNRYFKKLFKSNLSPSLMMQFLQKRTSESTGKLPWIHQGRCDYLSYCIEMRSVEEFKEYFMKCQNEDPPIFYDSCIFNILTEHKNPPFLEFVSPEWKESYGSSDESENWPVVTDKNKLKEIVDRKTKIFDVLMAGSTIPHKCLGKFCRKALEYGYVDIVSRIVEARNEDGSLKTPESFIKDLFIDLPLPAYLHEPLPEQKAFIQDSLSSMIEMFLNLKDKSGKFVINEEDIKSLFDLSKAEELPYGKKILSVLKKHQKNHPEDDRFSKGALQDFFKGVADKSSGEVSKDEKTESHTANQRSILSGVARKKTTTLVS